MHTSKKSFTYPEQRAIQAVLGLLDTGEVEFVNAPFFGGVRSSPLEIATDVPRLVDSFPYGDCTHLRTVVSFQIRNQTVATVSLVGAVKVAGTDLIQSWRLETITARRYYWRNDPEESREMFVVECGPDSGYSSVRASSDEVEEQFERDIRDALSLTAV